jgi:hypothetical protein
MQRDINDFVTIVRSKNGRVKINHNGQNQANIYQLLHELGFRKSKLENKRIYYRREGEKLIPSSFSNIVDTFFEKLKETEFINIPEDVRFFDILDHFYEKPPIKENALFTLFLTETLTETEAFNYKLLTDHVFKHKFEVQHLLSKLEEWKFDKTIDIASSITPNAPLYYKKVDEDKYLVFIHYNSKSNTNDGFDCWIATFAKTGHIGNKKPLALQQVRLSFNLERDFELIKKYIIS